jgi:predicted  nucleic acid-binding Zn-ribbon protein
VRTVINSAVEVLAAEQGELEKLLADIKGKLDSSHLRADVAQTQQDWELAEARWALEEQTHQCLSQRLQSLTQELHQSQRLDAHKVADLQMAVKELEREKVGISSRMREVEDEVALRGEITTKEMNVQFL